ncbi:hypothetical protein [Halocola ammonii]
MKKKTKGILFSLVLIILVAALAWQYFKKGVEVEKVTADIHFKGQEQLDIDMRILLDTRFFWDTKVYGIDYTLKLSDQVILEGRQNFDTLVINNKESIIPLALKLNPKELRSIIDSLQGTDSTYLELDYFIDYQLPIAGRQQMSSKKLKKVEVPIPPEIKLEDLKVKKLKLTEPLELRAFVKVINYGNVELIIEGLNYQFMVENEEWASGNLEESVKVEKTSNNIVELPVKISPGKVGNRLWQRFINRDSIHYSIKADGEIDLQLKKVDVQNIDFELNGVY